MKENKNLPLILNAVLAIGLAILYILHFTQKGGGAAAVSSNVANAKFSKDGVKFPIVYVNSDSLLLNYEFYKKTKKDLDGKQANLEGDLTSRAKQLENEIQNFQKNANSMTVQNAKNTEQQLMQKQQDLVQYREIVGRQYLDEERRMNDKLLDNIAKYMKKYGRDNGHIFVLGYSRGGGILYADSTLDVTAQVLKGLNDEYKANPEVIKEEKKEDKKEEKKK